jgi:hypothetical protein
MLWLGGVNLGTGGDIVRGGWWALLLPLHWWFSLFAVKFRVGVGSFPEPTVPGGVASCFSNAASIEVGVAASPHPTLVRAPKAGAAVCCCPTPPLPKALPPAPNTGTEGLAAGCPHALGGTNFATLSGVHAKPLPSRDIIRAREYESHDPTSEKVASTMHEHSPGARRPVMRRGCECCCGPRSGAVDLARARGGRKPVACGLPGGRCRCGDAAARRGGRKPVACSLPGGWCRCGDAAFCIYPKRVVQESSETKKFKRINIGQCT